MLFVFWLFIHTLDNKIERDNRKIRHVSLLQNGVVFKEWTTHDNVEWASLNNGLTFKDIKSNQQVNVIGDIIIEVE